MKKVLLILFIIIVFLAFFNNVKADENNEILLLKEDSRYDLKMEGYVISDESYYDLNKAGIYNLTYTKKDDSSVIKKDLVVIDETTYDNFDYSFIYDNEIYTDTEYKIIDFVQVYRGMAYLVECENSYKIRIITKDGTITTDAFGSKTSKEYYTSICYDETNKVIYCGGHTLLSNGNGYCITYRTISISGIVSTNTTFSLMGRHYLQDMLYKDNSLYFVFENNGVSGLVSHPTDDFDINVLKKDLLNNTLSLSKTGYLTNELYDNYYNDDIELLGVTYDNDTKYGLQIINTDQTINNETISYENFINYHMIKYDGYIYVVCNNDLEVRLVKLNYDLVVEETINYRIKDINVSNITVLDGLITVFVKDVSLNGKYGYIIFSEESVAGLTNINESDSLIYNKEENYVLNDSSLSLLKVNKLIQNNTNDVITYSFDNNNVLPVDSYSTLDFTLYGLYEKINIFNINNILYIYEVDDEVLFDGNIADENIYDIGFALDSNAKVYLNDTLLDNGYVFNNPGDYDLKIVGHNVTDKTATITIKEVEPEYTVKEITERVNITNIDKNNFEKGIVLENNQVVDNLSNEDYLDKLWYLMIPVFSSILTGAGMLLLGKKSI